MSDKLFNELVDAVINHSESGSSPWGISSREHFCSEYSAYAMELEQLTSLLHRAGYKELKDLSLGLDWLSIEGVSMSPDQINYLFTHCERVIAQREAKTSRCLVYTSIILSAIAAAASVISLVIAWGK